MQEATLVAGSPPCFLWQQGKQRLDFVFAVVEQTVYQSLDSFLACRSDVGIVDDSENIWSENQIQMRNGIAEGIKSHDASHRDFQFH